MNVYETGNYVPRHRAAVSSRMRSDNGHDGLSSDQPLLMQIHPRLRIEQLAERLQHHAC